MMTCAVVIFNIVKEPHHGYAYLNVFLIMSFQVYAEIFWGTAVDAMTPCLGFIVASSCLIHKPTTLD